MHGIVGRFKKQGRRFHRAMLLFSRALSRLNPSLNEFHLIPSVHFRSALHDEIEANRECHRTLPSLLDLYAARRLCAGDRRLRLALAETVVCGEFHELNAIHRFCSCTPLRRRSTR